jgi:hypothetical protein
MFSGGCSSLLSKRELVESAKKFFWLLWKHFRRKEMKEITRREKRHKRAQEQCLIAIFILKNVLLSESRQMKPNFETNHILSYSQASSITIVCFLIESYQEEFSKEKLILVFGFVQIQEYCNSGIHEFSKEKAFSSLVQDIAVDVIKK